MVKNRIVNQNRFSHFRTLICSIKITKRTIVSCFDLFRPKNNSHFLFFLNELKYRGICLVRLPLQTKSNYLFSAEKIYGKCDHELLQKHS